MNEIHEWKILTSTNVILLSNNNLRSIADKNIYQKWVSEW